MHSTKTFRINAIEQKEIFKIIFEYNLKCRRKSNSRIRKCMEKKPVPPKIQMLEEKLLLFREMLVSENVYYIFLQK